MQKLVLIVFIALLISAGGIVWYVENYNNKSYYVQIHSDGEIERDKTKSASLLGFYRYKINGFDLEGTEKELDFTANHNLKHDAYLKVRENSKRGVIGWEEVKRPSIPKKALDNLDKQKRYLVPPN